LGKKEKEKEIMPKGKGSYGSKRGRPPKKTKRMSKRKIKKVKK
jgi:hypothetical protein